MEDKHSLAQWRKERMLSQQQLSIKTGISVRTIQDYEQHRRKLSHAKIETVKRLADVLGCTMEDLLKSEMNETQS